MNNVGHGGKGESVWVAWFQIVIYEQFATLLEELGDSARAIDFESEQRNFAKLSKAMLGTENVIVARSLMMELL